MTLVLRLDQGTIQVWNFNIRKKKEKKSLTREQPDTL